MDLRDKDLQEGDQPRDPCHAMLRDPERLQGSADGGGRDARGVLTNLGDWRHVQESTMTPTFLAWVTGLMGTPLTRWGRGSLTV